MLTALARVHHCICSDVAPVALEIRSLDNAFMCPDTTQGQSQTCKQPCTQSTIVAPSNIQPDHVIEKHNVLPVKRSITFGEAIVLKVKCILIVLKNVVNKCIIDTSMHNINFGQHNMPIGLKSPKPITFTSPRYRNELEDLILDEVPAPTSSKRARKPAGFYHNP